MRKPKSFTLVEILLVTALFASVSLAVFTCLANGLKLWERSRGLVAQEDVAIFFDKFSSDLRNSFSFSTLSWEGGEYEVAFPAMVRARADRAGSRAAEGYADEIGRVRYVFDVAKGTLSRQQANYSQGTRQEWGMPQVLASGIKEVRFKYFFPGTRDYTLHVDKGGAIPSGVEVEVWTGDGESGRPQKRFISIPSGM